MTKVRCHRSMKFLLPLCIVLTASGSARGQGASSPATHSSAKSAASTPKAPVLEPKALEILKASCARLAAANSISFTSVETFENPSRQGFPLAYGTQSHVLLQRPDKLRVITVGDGPASEFYYNGKTMTAYAPVENLVAVADAPATADQMLGTAYHSASIYFAFDDMLVSDPYADIAQGMTIAYYVGQSKIVGGIVTDIVVYESGGVYIQAWIGADDKLPRLIRAIYVNDPTKSRHALVLTDWKLDEAVPADAFATAKASGAGHIPFAPPASPAGSFKPVKKATKAPTKP